MFVHQANWFGLSCEEKTFNKLQKYFTEQKPYFTDPYYVRWESPLYGIPINIIAGYPAQSDYLKVFAHNSECKLNPQKQKMFFEGDVFAKALEFIKEPDFQIFEKPANAISSLTYQ